MRSYIKIYIVLTVLLIWGCGGEQRPATPVETLKAYQIAVRNKDTTMMKLLLSEASLKLHQEEAKARGVTLDEIVHEQTLFPADQRFFDYRNEKVEGNKATVEVKNDFGGWDMVHLVREGGAWRIDRKSTTDQIIEDIEEQNRKLDEMIEKGRQDTEQIPEPADDPTKNDGGIPADPSLSPSPGTSPQPGDDQAIRKGPPPAIN